MEGYLSADSIERLGRNMPQGVVQFIESNVVAVWDSEILAYRLTGNLRIYPDATQLVRLYGPYRQLRAD